MTTNFLYISVYVFIWKYECLIIESKTISDFNQCIKIYLLGKNETNFSAKNMLKASLSVPEKLKENTKIQARF